jgi:hypothetical protein
MNAQHKELIATMHIGDKIAEAIANKATHITLQDDRGGSGSWILIHDAQASVEDIAVLTELEKKLFGCLIAMANHADEDTPLAYRSPEFRDTLVYSNDIIQETWEYVNLTTELAKGTK